MAMKALIVNSVCKEGSTGKIAYGLHKYLKSKGHTSIVCYGRGKAYYDESGLIKLESYAEVVFHAFMARLTGLQGYFSNRATKRLLKIVKEYRPDVIYLLNLHGYYLNEFKLLNELRDRKYLTVYVMPDEYPFAGKCCYTEECMQFETECKKCPEVKSYPKSLIFDRANYIFKSKMKIYKGFDSLIIGAVPYLLDKAKKSTLLSGKKMVAVDTGIDMENMYYPRDPTALRKRLSIPLNHKVVLNVAQYTNTRKGVQYFLSAAECMLDSNITFINVGFDGDASICPENFIPIPYVSDQDELAQYYSLADIFVCTSLADAMPNACLEALACGTPLCGFAISGMVYIAHSELCRLVQPKNVDDLVSVVAQCAPKTSEMVKMCREYAAARYSSEVYFSKLEGIGVEFNGRKE